jgi:hypothetical protein
MASEESRFVDHPPSLAIWKRVDAWYWPFLFLLALPSITIPATLALRFVGSESVCTRVCLSLTYCPLDCPTAWMVATLAPGLLGLMCFHWRKSEKPNVRSAARIVGALAIARLVGPAAAMVAGGPETRLFLSTFAGARDLEVSVLLWVITLSAALVYGLTIHKRRKGTLERDELRG